MKTSAVFANPTTRPVILRPVSGSQRRAVRLAAKAPGRGATGDVPRNDDEAPPSARRATSASKSSGKTDGSGYLTLYFRDMQELHVLQPEEEFKSAREIEALELVLWAELLAFAPALPAVLDAIDLAVPDVAEVKAVRKVAALGRALTAGKLAKVAARAATALREVDADRLFVDAALGAVDRLERSVRPADKAVRASRGFVDWLRRVEVAARGAHDARNSFVKANLRLVISIARRFNHGRMSLADLIQEGNLGLMKAVERYDYRRGFRFSTYASWWIRHAISRALADKGREVRLPVHMIDAQHRLTKAKRALTGELGREPTVEELAIALQMPLDKVEKMRTWVLEQSVPLDGPTGDADGRVLAEVLEDPDRDPSTNRTTWPARPCCARSRTCSASCGRSRPRSCGSASACRPSRS